MRTLNAVGAGVGVSILTVHRAWPIGYALVLAGVVRLLHGLLAERARRRTLEVLCERAPIGTLIVQEQGLGGPAMLVKIGETLPESESSIGLPDGTTASREMAGRTRK